MLPFGLMDENPDKAFSEAYNREYKKKWGYDWDGFIVEDNFMKDLADSFSVVNKARDEYCSDMAPIDCEKYC